MSKVKEYEIKTKLTEGQWLAMQQVIEAKGLTTAGYIRHLILRSIVDSQDLVSQMNAIEERAKKGISGVPLKAVQS